MVSSRRLTGRKLSRVLVLVLLAAALADGATSLFLIHDGLFLGRRPLPPFGVLTHPKQRETLEKLSEPPRGSWTFDADLGWTWRPSSSNGDGLYVIDALGARGPREYAARPTPPVRRVICFGDSYTYCDEVPPADSFETQMEGADPRFEVLNFGVSAYGTDQALLRYEHVGRDLGAEVACLGIMLENIGRNVNRYRPLWAPFSGQCVTKPRFVLEPGGELRLLPQPFASREELLAALRDGSVLDRIAEHEYWLDRPSVPTGRLSSLVRLLCGYVAYRERTPARLWQEVAGEPFQVTLALLERFHSEALADGARLAPILLFPPEEDLVRYAVPGRPYWDGLLAELARRGVPVIDLVTPLAARARELGSASTLYEGGHLSRAGNALVAREVLAWIAAQSP